MTGIPTATVPELNDEYIEKMEDVLGTYEQPYNPAEPVVCLEEKPSVHAERNDFRCICEPRRQRKKGSQASC